MKRYFKLLVLGIGLMGMFSCGGEDEPIVDSGNNPDENPVEPPGGFTPDQAYEEDRKLLNLVQKESFLYMWDYGHPVSGLAYERYPGEGVVTIGGSGFGIASIVVACERGWITRQEAVARMLKITDFLKNKSERTKLHGAFPHWMNGETGKTVQFSEGDDGADIVETAFLFEGLLIARQYFAGTGDEEIIRNNITTMWEEMEWDWFTQGQNVLYWHWSPNTGFNKNMQITGFNECMMTYILAVSSPTHPVSRAVYDAWTSTSGYMQRVHNGYTIEAAVDYCGPLFFTHYSFIGLDPRKIADEFVTKGYFIRNTTHTLINRAYCLETAPKTNKYSEKSWGLTASYATDGYTASSPKNDVGTIAPTAALSSMPYTPHYSMQVLWNLYSNKDKYWGKYGPFDAYCDSRNWVSTDKYLAIDQLPIVCMIENYRSGLLWNLFMKDADLKNGLSVAGLHYPEYKTGFPLMMTTKEYVDGTYKAIAHDLRRHPDTGLYTVPFYCQSAGEVTFKVTDSGNRLIKEIQVSAAQGENTLSFEQFVNTTEEVYTLTMVYSGGEAKLKIRMN